MAKLEKATFGAGCFWCVEAVFQRLPGVKSVLSGYTGGIKPSPTYKEVCSGKTGHIEAVQITFDQDKITYDRLLDVFWQSHDPTQVNRQGPDTGEQYSSVIFYHDEKQKEAAEKSKAKAQKNFDRPIMTGIRPFKTFYKAEDSHQNFYNKNRFNPYCILIIRPKLKKLKLE